MNLVRYTSLLLLLFLSSSSCINQQDQLNFEQQAFLSPRGFTQTNDNGTIITRDPDDWRIAPYFQGLVEVFTPAFPNPTDGREITLEVMITGIDAIFGLEVFTRRADGQVVTLYLDNRLPLPTGLNVIRINPISFSFNNTLGSAQGLHRIFLYDRNNRIISYGDIMVDLGI